MRFSGVESEIAVARAGRIQKLSGSERNRRLAAAVQPRLYIGF